MHRSQFPALKKIVLLVYLMIALVFIQGMRLHVHAYNHVSATPDHAHLGQAHFAYDVSEVEHPDEVAKIDLSQQWLLKKLLLGSLAIALLAAMLILCSARLCSPVLRHRNSSALSMPRRTSLPPPSRGPPR